MMMMMMMMMMMSILSPFDHRTALAVQDTRLLAYIALMQAHVNESSCTCTRLP
jgi:hypothetical protein